MSTEQVNETLEELIETCQEGIKSYRDAAEHIVHPDLKTILYRLSQQRALFEAELKDDMRDMGGNPDKNTSDMKGTLQQIWMNFKAGLHGEDTNAILNECKKIESSAMRSYEDALAKELPGYIKERVEQQYKLIRGAYDQLVEFQQNPS